MHQRQSADDDAQDGRRLPLVVHADQPQEVASVRQSEEDELRGLTQHPGVVRRQRHRVGVSEGGGDRKRCFNRCCDVMVKLGTITNKSINLNYR